MKGCLTWLAAGLGVGIGGGLIYLFIVSEMAWIIFMALGMFVLGAAVMALALLFQNRQWTKAVFEGSQPRVSNNYRMPAYPPYPPASQQAYLPAPQFEPYQFQIIENQPASALTDDGPMA